MGLCCALEALLDDGVAERCVVTKRKSSVCAGAMRDRWGNEGLQGGVPDTFADCRGRIYTNSYYSSYQGSDLSLALIQFNESQKVTTKGLYFYFYFYLWS